MNLWPLLGILVVVAGFLARLHPVLVVAAAAVTTGLLAGLGPLGLLEILGASFLRNRFLLLFVLTLPVIGLLERRGLREMARAWAGRLRGATAGRILILYLLLRQGLSSLGLTSVAGQAQTVRPLLAPMVEAAAERARGPLEAPLRHGLRAMAAATDNVGLFFGEDVFIAFGAVLLIRGFFQDHGIVLDPLRIALWGLPTGIAAFLIHGARLLRLDVRPKGEGPVP